LKDPDRPIGSFIFLGPTGVGKTELARALAQYLFDDEQNMIRIDMSEYMEQHSISRLIGSPPGYVGYEEGGQLTEAVRRRPFRVVLFDEIEKAHPDVFNILLQILEDGRLTDGQGRTVDFRNTLIIITSNLGTADLSKPAPGFRRETDPKNESARMRASIESQIKNTFRPEFLNRIDEIIIFETLSEGQIKEIVNLMTGSVEERLSVHSVRISLTEGAKSWIAEKGFDPVYGARPLRRVIQRELENKLARRILKGEFSKGDKITVDVSKDGLNFEKNI
jgi:ATP-dependent Clp protease ATP-binding subunit ClpC